MMNSASIPGLALCDKSCITLVAAKLAAVKAHAQARSRNSTVAVSVVDDGGHLICLERGDRLAPGMAEASILKARSAALFGVPTHALADGVRQGQSGYLKLPGALPLEGGVPVVIDGYVIGAVGVAGGTSSDDAAAALAAVEAILALALEPLERDAPGEVQA